MVSGYWLMKAEPDSRIVKGVDVKFSVDDFEAVKVTAWEGVRNYEARNLMIQMEMGDKVLFYHSNCKNPGIAAFAEVSQEAYPDNTAWDPNHPYFDPKTDKATPRWFMVNLKFVSRATHFVPLSLLKSIAALPADADPPAGIQYIDREGVQWIKDMALVNRGRLSVQRVSEECWGVIEKLAENNGWDQELLKAPKASKVVKRKMVRNKGVAEDGRNSGVQNESNSKEEGRVSKAGSSAARKRKAGEYLIEETQFISHTRRSLRTRRSG